MCYTLVMVSASYRLFLMGTKKLINLRRQQQWNVVRGVWLQNVNAHYVDMQTVTCPQSLCSQWSPDVKKNRSTIDSVLL